MTDSSICSPVGSAQSSGTGTLAHSKPGSQGVQSIPVPGAVLVGAPVVGAAAAAVVEFAGVDASPPSSSPQPTPMSATTVTAATTPDRRRLAARGLLVFAVTIAV